MCHDQISNPMRILLLILSIRRIVSCRQHWECQSRRPWLRCDQGECVCEWPCTSSTCGFLNGTVAVQCPEGFVHVRSSSLCGAAYGKGYVHCCMPHPPDPPSSLSEHALLERDWMDDPSMLRVSARIPCEEGLSRRDWECYTHTNATMVALSSPSTVVSTGVGVMWIHITTTRLRIEFPRTHETRAALDGHCLYRTGGQRPLKSRTGFQTTAALWEAYRGSEEMAASLGLTLTTTSSGVMEVEPSPTIEMVGLLSLVRREMLPVTDFYDEYGWYASGWGESIVCWRTPHQDSQPLLRPPTFDRKGTTTCEEIRRPTSASTMRLRMRDVLLRHDLCPLIPL